MFEPSFFQRGNNKCHRTNEDESNSEVQSPDICEIESFPKALSLLLPMREISGNCQKNDYQSNCSDWRAISMSELSSVQQGSKRTYLIRNTHLQVVRLFISPPTSGPVNMAMAPTAASQRYVIDGPAAKKHSSK